MSNNLSFRHLVLFAMLVVTLPSKSYNIDFVVNMAVEQMKQSGVLSGISSCLNVKENEFLKAYTKTVRHCLNKHGMDESSEAAVQSCFTDQTKARLNVSDSVFNQCSQKFAETEEEAEVDYAELSDEEFDKHLEKKRLEEIETMKSMVEMSHAMNKGTEKNITLPVFPGSKIIAHYQKGMTINENTQTLPVATFSSTKKVQEVVDFYRKKLPKFKLKKDSDQSFILMESIPEGFDTLKDIALLYNTPHIEIYKNGSAKDADTSIVISYQLK